VIGAMRHRLRQEGTAWQVMSSVAGIGSVGTQGNKFREDWSLWQRR